MATGLTAEQAKQQVEEITPAQAREELAGGDVILLDTREPHERAESHVEGSVLVPPAEVLARADEVAPDADARVLIYCRSGNRSAVAAHQLAEQLG